MSVVNKMLQDLEARQSQTDEIQADYQPPEKKQSKLLLLVLLILAIAAIIFALTDISQLLSEKQTSTTATHSQPLPVTVTKKINAVPEKRQLTSESPPKVKPELATKTTKLFAEEPILPQKHQTVTTKLVSIQNIQSPDNQAKTQDITTPNIQAPPEKESSFSMTGSSQENNSSSLKQRIAENLSNNNLDLAQSLLHELLETEPDNIKARKKLASLLFAQGNYAQSQQLLAQGIELHPTKSDIRLMLARLYVVQKEPSQAMNILVDFQPSVDNRSEYLAYRAALAQQLKQTELARSDYQALTNIESTNAKWWLGLAIAEDQLGDINMAVKAYKMANSLGQLDGSVNEFIQQRISVLAGAL
jgi:MSHA biogenesis protein MshN